MPGSLLLTSCDNIRGDLETKNYNVYRIDSTPLERKELKDSPGENITFLVESSLSKVLNDLIKSVQGLKGTVEKNKEEFSQKIESLEAKIKEHKLTITNFNAKEKARAIYQNISTSRLLFVVSWVYELEQSIHTFTKTLPNKFYETSPQEYETLVLNKKNKKKNITYYDVLALESDSARKKLLNSIQQNFDKEHETYERVDLVIVS